MREMYYCKFFLNYITLLIKFKFYFKIRKYHEISDEDRPIFKLIQTNIAIVLGYTLSDMLNIVLNFFSQSKYKSNGDIFILIHHCFSLYGFTYALVSLRSYMLKFLSYC